MTTKCTRNENTMVNASTLPDKAKANTIVSTGDADKSSKSSIGLDDEFPLADSSENGVVTVNIKKMNSTGFGHKHLGKSKLRWEKVEGRLVFRAAKENIASVCTFFAVVPRTEGGGGLRPKVVKNVIRSGKEVYIVIGLFKDISKAINMQMEGEDIKRHFSNGEDRMFHITFSSMEAAQNFADICYQDSIGPTSESCGEDTDDSEHSPNEDSDDDSISGSADEDEREIDESDDDESDDECPYIEESQDAYLITNLMSSCRFRAPGDTQATIDEEEDE